jgi:hypothetical protein
MNNPLRSALPLDSLREPFSWVGAETHSSSERAEL